MIWVINGPNLQALGTRQPDIYGDLPLATLQDQWVAFGTQRGVIVQCRQSNHEGTIIDWLYEARPSRGVILNAGAFTHTSVAIRDAIVAISPCPVIEVHISNVYARESFRAHSMIAPVCRGSISGLGVMGYELAIQAILGLGLPSPPIG